MDGLVFGFIILCVFLLVAAMRKAPSSGNANTSKSTVIYTNTTPEIALKQTIIYAQSSGYKIANLEKDRFFIVLEEGASMNSYGFYYPITILEESAGNTKIRIGIKSKAIQVGPVVTRSLEKMVNGLEAALLANT